MARPTPEQRQRTLRSSYELLLEDVEAGDADPDALAAWLALHPDFTPEEG